MVHVEPRVIRLRYPAACAGCGAELARSTEAAWDAASKTATCVPCMTGAQAEAVPEPTTSLAPPTGGVSAQREHDRRSAKRAASIRAAHPRIGGLILALSDDPTSTRVWAKGAEGERRVARRLNELTAEGTVVLHDRRIPRSKANIDHLVIGPTGVTIIDSKRYNGRVEVRSAGTLFRPGPNKLFVHGRDKTALLDGLGRQVTAIHAAAGELIAATGTMITPVLCFVDAEWGFLAKPYQLDGIHITWPKALMAQLRQPGPLTPDQVAALTERVSSTFPPA